MEDLSVEIKIGSNKNSPITIRRGCNHPNDAKGKGGNNSWDLIWIFFDHSRKLYHRVVNAVPRKLTSNE